VIEYYDDDDDDDDLIDLKVCMGIKEVVGGGLFSAVALVGWWFEVRTTNIVNR
jgi:hypothetical protein